MESLKRLDMDDEEEKMEREAGLVMARLESYMQAKHLRVHDLFEMLDADGRYGDDNLI